MLDDLRKIKKLYESGENIIDFLKNKYGKNYDISDFSAISYDIQAGSYIEKSKLNPEYEKVRGTEFSKILNQLGDYRVLLESGIGEGTSHASIAPFLSNNNYKLLGFDISYSRIQYANRFLNQQHNVMKNKLFLGDYLNCPLADNSVDIVYTVHSIEPSKGKELEIIKELYRVAGKYLVLFEPSYELGNTLSRQYIEKRSYVKNLHQATKDLNLKVIEYKILFDSNDLTSNNTAVMVIEKDQDFISSNSDEIDWVCPITKTHLEDMGDCFYSQESLLLYPLVSSIPCLLAKNAIIASHFFNFYK